jgi:hypothetical protein
MSSEAHHLSKDVHRREEFHPLDVEFFPTVDSDNCRDSCEFVLGKVRPLRDAVSR